MVEKTVISLASLPMEELAGVVNMYPWYGGARKELCRRMSRSGGASWGVEQYAAEALHIADRAGVAAILRRGRDEDLSDRDVERILKSYITFDTPAPAPAIVREQPRTRIPGGDYFSQEEYDEVRRADDNALSNAVRAVRQEPEAEHEAPAPEKPVRPRSDVFCTETLAGIYASQGYFEDAKQIYSKLLLAFPEKNAYFASLIEKMDHLAKS